LHPPTELTIVVPPLVQQDSGKLIVYVVGRLYMVPPPVILCRFCRRARVKGLGGGDEARRRRRPYANKDDEKFRQQSITIDVLTYSIRCT
jgi:hypothetical protein